MKDQTLQAIDESVVTAAKFLEDFANDPKKRECLRAYAESQSIVKWIREETKGILLLQFIILQSNMSARRCGCIGRISASCNLAACCCWHSLLDSLLYSALLSSLLHTVAAEQHTVM